jgi:AbiTii
MTVSKNEEIAALALEVLEDVEMSRASVESLALKASRLARLADDEETIRWLHCERFGYHHIGNPLEEKYAELTKRRIDQETYVAPLVDIETAVMGIENKIQAAMSFKPTGSHGIPQFGNQQKTLTNLHHSALPFRRILSAVRAHIQNFAPRTYYEKLFSHQAESIFEKYQSEVDALLAATAQTAFTRLPQAFERLIAGDKEAISHALTTCRRVIDSFADAVYPPMAGHALIGQHHTEVGEKHVRNRLRAYIFDRIGQGSRYERLNKSLGSLYDRVSAGVHADVGIGEARALVLHTYLLLGELLSLSAERASGSDTE